MRKVSPYLASVFDHIKLLEQRLKITDALLDTCESPYAEDIIECLYDKAPRL